MPAPRGVRPATSPRPPACGGCAPSLPTTKRSDSNRSARLPEWDIAIPEGRFDIIELDGERIGRIIVNRLGMQVHIVDHAIVPRLRNRGIGTAIMRALMDEARAARLPLRLKVASSNDPSLRHYLRLGFVPIEAIPAYIELEWPPPSHALSLAQLTERQPYRHRALARRQAFILHCRVTDRLACARASPPELVAWRWTSKPSFS
jgi:RimJ/RimL family protein N-acetyltransferase